MHGHSGRVAGVVVLVAVCSCFCVCLRWTWTLFDGTILSWYQIFVFNPAFPGLSDSVGDPYVDEGLKLNFERHTRFVSKFQAEVMQQHWVVTSGKIRKRKCQRHLDMHRNLR